VFQHRLLVVTVEKRTSVVTARQRDARWIMHNDTMYITSSTTTKHGGEYSIPMTLDAPAACTGTSAAILEIF
jgi:hypothetical protein